MKIVIANSVGIDSEGYSIIPYHSRWTTSAKGRSGAFTYYPRDLGYLCALLKRDTDHEVVLLDGCLNRVESDEYVKIIADQNPDWLVMESSSRTWVDDKSVAQSVKALTGSKTLMTGQHVSAFPESALDGADAIATGEYLGSVRDFFVGGATGMEIIEGKPENFIDINELPFPEDEDVSRLAYAKNADPICEYTEAQAWVSRGCPYGCAYCVARHTYYQKPMWRSRPVENVVEELLYLFDKYKKLEGVFFDDEIHNANIGYTKKLAQAIISAGLDNYRYEAMCAYAPFDEESLRLLRQAGYYKVRVGVETADDDMATAMQLKGKHRPGRLMRFLEMAKDVDLKVYATFTLGGRGGSKKADLATVKLMENIMRKDLIDDCQISICTPQPGTPFYDWALANGFVPSPNDEQWRDFDGGEKAVISLPGYVDKEIRQMRTTALCAYDSARAEREKVRYTKNVIKNINTLGQMPTHILTFRSARKWALDLLLDALATLGDMSITFLCHESEIKNFKKRDTELETIKAPDGEFLDWSNLSQASKKRIKTIRPDLILIPVTTAREANYTNVMEIAGMTAGDSAVFMVDSSGTFTKISDPEIINCP